MFCIIVYVVDTKFRKRHFDSREIATIKKHLADQKEQHMGEDGKERMCFDQLWEMNAGLPCTWIVTIQVCSV